MSYWRKRPLKKCLFTVKRSTSVFRLKIPAVQLLRFPRLAVQWGASLTVAFSLFLFSPLPPLPLSLPFAALVVWRYASVRADFLLINCLFAVLRTRIACEVCQTKKGLEKKCLTYKYQKVICAPSQRRKSRNKVLQALERGVCGEVAERLKALLLREYAVKSRIRGSNPRLTAILHP